MLDSPITKSIARQARLMRLVLIYCGLRMQLVYLHIKYHVIKIGGAALIEAVKIEYLIKSWTKGDRVMFAACIALMFYCLAFYLRIRI